MDSSSSGSIQSSSGGGGVGNVTGSHEEEYTSAPNREILSPFNLPLNNSTQYPYPFSNYQDAFQLNPNQNLSRTSIDSTWPSSTQLLPSCTDNNVQLLTSASSASMQPPVPPDNRQMATINSAPSRGSKKRSRASRRPPTTVLTTDTTNFRAMVQEFTGFPAAPFVPASPFVRPRLGTGLGLFQSGSNNNAFSSPYLLRPFPQKLQNNPSIPPNNLSSSAIVDAIASIARSSNITSLNTMFGTSNATSTSSSGSNTNFVNASTTSIATTSSIDPISDFANMHSNQAPNTKYNFAAQGDLDGLVGSNGSNPTRLHGFDPDKSRFANLESENQAMEKGLFGFLNYAGLRDKR